jgi:hypothetical protein
MQEKTHKLKFKNIRKDKCVIPTNFASPADKCELESPLINKGKAGSNPIRTKDKKFA